jgi:hypothetical protein
VLGEHGISIAPSTYYERLRQPISDESPNREATT